MIPFQRKVGQRSGLHVRMRAGEIQIAEADGKYIAGAPANEALTPQVREHQILNRKSEEWQDRQYDGPSPIRSGNGTLPPSTVQAVKTPPTARPKATPSSWHKAPVAAGAAREKSCKYDNVYYQPLVRALSVS